MALPISYNVRNLRVRWQVTLLAIIGIALVVARVRRPRRDGRRLPHRAAFDRAASTTSWSCRRAPMAR